MLQGRHSQDGVGLDRLDIQSSDSRSLKPFALKSLVPENR